MRVLTFSWEFPPVKNGGLGVACYGLTQELLADGIDVLLVLPKTQKVAGGATVLFANTERLISVGGVDQIYYGSYCDSDTDVHSITGYDESGKAIVRRRAIIDEAYYFAERSAEIASLEQFDVIHAHDWTSYLAGMSAKIATGKKLIVHVHATSYDQAGGDMVDPSIKHIEQQAFALADQVVTVSQYTKDLIVQKHGVDPDKVSVVHNGCVASPTVQHAPVLQSLKKAGKKIVLYHGRISIQKGVDYLVQAARRVVDADPDVVFVISGSGDMQGQIMQQVGALGLSEYVRFAGALWDDDRDKMYQAADVFVMPSVSEPFGLVPLEAIQHDTPVIISKQSGVAEILDHALKVDFWDVEQLANQIISSLRYPVLRRQLVSEGKEQVKKFTWRRAAEKVVDLYRRLVQYAKS